MPNKYDDDYTRVYWENLPSHNTPINQQNLNKMDAQIKTLTTRVSDMSAYIPNVMYVDELPEQGVEGLLYVESIIEHGFELTGLPERYQSQSALDTWINQGNFAFMLHLSSVVTDDTYAIIENVLVKTVTSIPDEYTVSEMNGDVTTYYLYDPDTKTWDSSTYGTLSVNDIIVGIGQVNINSKLPTHYYATGGDISDNLGIENIIGDMTITSNTSHYSPPITYSDNNNTYEIYQAKPIQVLSPKNVYMWSDDTRSFFGFQKEYEAGQNITFTQQGTKVIISATGGADYNNGDGIDIDDNTIKVKLRSFNSGLAFTNSGELYATGGGGGGGGISPILFETYPDVECSITYAELLALYNEYGGALPIYIHDYGVSSSNGLEYFPLSEIRYVANDNQFKLYFNVSVDQTTIHKVTVLTFSSDDTIVETFLQTNYQTQLSSSNAGDGISIGYDSGGTLKISVNYPNGDIIAY